jgi:hypothetical protein
MNKVILQLWEESDSKIGQTSDGCSLHIDMSYCKYYINSVYGGRTDNIPDTYDRILGEPIEVNVNDVLFAILIKDKTIRLHQHEMNNLINLNEIELEND